MDRLLRATIKINHIMGSLLPNLSHVIIAVTGELNKLFPSFTIKLWLHDTQGYSEELTGLIAKGFIGLNSNCTVVSEGLPLLVPDTRCEAGCGGCPSGATISHVCLPVTAGKDVLGCLSMCSNLVQEVSRVELEVLVSIVNQVGVALQRSRLISNLKSEKVALEYANQEILALNRELTGAIEHLQKTQAQLIRTERLAATGRLAANLAHEINNPTGILLSRLDLIMLDRQANDPGLTNDLFVIQRQAQRIAEITRGLLTFSRQEKNTTPVVRQPVDLRKLVQETCSWLEEQFHRQGIEVSLDLDTVPLVHANPSHIQQVLVNLLTNARDAMPKGGSIHVILSSEPSGQNVRLKVADTGQGIPELELDLIFEPFYTSKDPGLGTGLGLYVTYTIIKEHHGEITVSSKIGRGTTFTITLPAGKENDLMSENEN